MGINCCNGCVPPKRNPYCHISCPEYLADKAENERRKAEYYKAEKISVAINLERGKKVYNALKDRARK